MAEKIIQLTICLFAIILLIQGAAHALSVTSPATNTVWKSGTRQTVSWTPSLTKYQIQYSHDGASWTTICETPTYGVNPARGQEIWDISEGCTGGDAYIRIYDIVSQTYSPQIKFAIIGKEWGTPEWNPGPSGTFTGSATIEAGEVTTKGGEFWFDSFTINAGGAVYVDPAVKYLIIHARTIQINGIIEATGRGYSGRNGGSGGTGNTTYPGTGGGGGAAWMYDGQAYVYWGGNGLSGGPGNPGLTGMGPFGGNPGTGGDPVGEASGGSPGWHNPGANPELVAAGNGTPGNNGDIGDVGLKGGYNFTSGNNDTSIATEELYVGSGGGGGGGGGHGSGGGGGGGWVDCDGSDSTAGGAGGNGGNGASGREGGAGGGYVKLYATRSINITGQIITRGLAGKASYNGEVGVPGSEDPYPYSPYAGHGAQGGAGGYGGTGGAGAGGGVLIKCLASSGITIGTSAQIITWGGDATYPEVNGGTVKIFYAGSAPSNQNRIYAGKSSATNSEALFTFAQSTQEEPNIPSNPSPANGASGVPLHVTLSWTGGGPSGSGTPTYEVYYKKSTNSTWTKIPHANPLATQEILDLSSQSTEYNWKVVSRNNFFAVEGPVWSLTTIGPTGTIKVKTFKHNPVNSTTSPLSAGFIISKEAVTIYDDSTGVNGTWEAASAALGTYEVSYDAIAGYTTPANKTLYLKTDGGAVTFEATYELNDLDPPSPPTLNPPVVNGDLVTFSWSPSDDGVNGSGIAGYTLHISGLPDITNIKTTICTRELGDGTYSAQVTAFDKVGLSADSNIVSAVVNTCAPSLTLSIKKGSNETKFTTNRLTPPVAVSFGSTISLTATDGNGIASTNITIKDKTGVTVGTASASLVLNSLTFKENEIYNISAEATDGLRLSSITVVIQLFPADIQVINGDPFNYPNPFDPLKGTTIKFYLSDYADTKILVYNIAGKPVLQKLCKAGLDEGAKQDLNLVVWDGKDNFQNYVANGPYFYFIIVEGKVIGKGDMAAFK